MGRKVHIFEHGNYVSVYYAKEKTPLGEFVSEMLTYQVDTFEVDHIPSYKVYELLLERIHYFYTLYGIVHFPIVNNFEDGFSIIVKREILHDLIDYLETMTAHDDMDIVSMVKRTKEEAKI